MKRALRIRALLPALALAALPAHVRAGDGVREINQACAASAKGCFAGDAAGFPVEITQPGSYRVTSPLQAGAGDAIHVTASDVTLDLGGFTIAGAGTCSGEGAALACSGAAGIGVRVDAENAELRSGTIRGFQTGVSVAAGAFTALRQLRVAECSVAGVSANGTLLVADSALERSGVGLAAPSVLALVVRSELRGNQGDGASLRGLTASSTFAGNGQNGLTATDALVLANTLESNGGFGLAIDGAQQRVVAYGENVIVGNSGGTVSQPVANSGVRLGTNVCNTGTTCP